MPARYETSIEIALAALKAAKATLSAEISSYPTPIAGCDAQFNQLLSDRTRLHNAIHAIESRPFVPTPRSLEPAIPSNSL